MGFRGDGRRNPALRFDLVSCQTVSKVPELTIGYPGLHGPVGRLLRFPCPHDPPVKISLRYSDQIKEILTQTSLGVSNVAPAERQTHGLFVHPCLRFE